MALKRIKRELDQLKNKPVIGFQAVDLIQNSFEIPFTWTLHDIDVESYRIFKRYLLLLQTRGILKIFPNEILLIIKDYLALEDKTISFTLSFPPDYPFKPFKIRVDNDSSIEAVSWHNYRGISLSIFNICFIKKDWSPRKTIASVLKDLSYMFPENKAYNAHFLVPFLFSDTLRTTEYSYVSLWINPRKISFNDIFPLINDRLNELFAPKDWELSSIDCGEIFPRDIPLYGAFLHQANTNNLRAFYIQMIKQSKFKSDSISEYTEAVDLDLPMQIEQKEIVRKDSSKAHEHFSEATDIMAPFSYADSTSATVSVCLNSAAIEEDLESEYLYDVIASLQEDTFDLEDEILQAVLLETLTND